MGRSSTKTTEIYTHVTFHHVAAIRSPVDKISSKITNEQPPGFNLDKVVGIKDQPDCNLSYDFAWLFIEGVGRNIYWPYLR